LLNEVSDETRFRKKIGTSLAQVRNLVHDGLFTVSSKDDLASS
jgi:cytochrome P450/NADPH-cytochrome P450 reductase